MNLLKKRITPYNRGNLKGGRPSSTYRLSPTAFKFILMRSQKQKKYADYYLLLEKCVKYYSDYQIQLLKSKVSDICDDRILKLSDPDKKECFVLLKNNQFKEHPYSVIRGQIKSFRKTLTKLKLTEDDVILNIECCHANNMYNKIKEKLSGFITCQTKYLYLDDNGHVEESAFQPDLLINEYNHVSITRNIGINGMTIDEFVNVIKKLDSERHAYKFRCICSILRRQILHNIKHIY